MRQVEITEEYGGYRLTIYDERKDMIGHWKAETIEELREIDTKTASLEPMFTDPSLWSFNDDDKISG